MRESSGALRLSGGKTPRFVALIEPTPDTESLAPDSPFAGDLDKRKHIQIFMTVSNYDLSKNPAIRISLTP